MSRVFFQGNGKEAGAQCRIRLGLFFFSTVHRRAYSIRGGTTHKHWPDDGYHRSATGQPQAKGAGMYSPPPNSVDMVLAAPGEFLWICVNF